MRAIVLGLTALALAACSQTVVSGGVARTPLPSTAQSEWPFPQAPRGSAIAPPGAGAAAQSAPPEGAGAGGIDFGRWRSADADAYSAQFQTQMRARYANQEVSYIRSNLQANGFACEEGGTLTLQCRIEISERQCSYDWYVVLDREHAPPAAGFDAVCPQTRTSR